MGSFFLSTDTRATAIPARWGAALTAYRDALTAAGQSPATINQRMAQLARLARAFPAGPVIRQADLLSWVAAKDWRRETRRSHYAAFRRFYSFALAAGTLDDNPALALPPVKPETPKARPAPEVAYRHALGVADPRTRLILRLAAEVGLRRGEIVQVHARDLSRDLLGYSLTVHGKGGKQRIVPLPDHVGIELERQAREGGGYVFPSHQGHITPAYAGKLARAVLPDPWTLHTLRHRFATRAYQADHDLFAVQTLLGHRSPETTRRYVADDQATLRRAMLAAVA